MTCLTVSGDIGAAAGWVLQPVADPSAVPLPRSLPKPAAVLPIRHQRTRLRNRSRRCYWNSSSKTVTLIGPQSREASRMFTSGLYLRLPSVPATSELAGRF
jgi:hypothetical protein